MIMVFRRCRGYAEKYFDSSVMAENILSCIKKCQSKNEKSYKNKDRKISREI